MCHEGPAAYNELPATVPLLKGAAHSGDQAPDAGALSHPVTLGADMGRGTHFGARWRFDCAKATAGVSIPAATVNISILLNMRKIHHYLGLLDRLALLFRRPPD